MQEEQKTSWLLRLRESIKERRKRRMQRKEEPPWLFTTVWRHCPENLHKVASLIFWILGMLSMCLFLQAVLWGFIGGPLMYARSQSSAPLAIWIRHYLNWLRAHLSEDNFGPVYYSLQMCIAAILFYFIRVGIWWLRKNPWNKSEESKADVT
ncbi:MAG: hypothetical protein QOD03_1731 [Verrucomicrobiota bacterium]|jgi:hypothetical protein